MGMATVIVDGGGSGPSAHAQTPGAGWIVVGALTGLALLAFTTPLGSEADAAYWYELGRALPAQRATALSHLEAMEKTATGSALALIQKDVSVLKALGTGTKTPSSGGG